MSASIGVTSQVDRRKGGNLGCVVVEEKKTISVVRSFGSGPPSLLWRGFGKARDIMRSGLLLLVELFGLLTIPF